jgi:hypothetical protein
MTIPKGQTSHEGAHTHSKTDQPFHFCEVRCVILAEALSLRMLTRYSCESCNYFCTLPLGIVPATPQSATDANGYSSIVKVILNKNTKLAMAP